jgi:septum formation protein
MQTGHFTIKVNLQSHTKELLLASTSQYRRELLARLCLPFTSQPPKVDESLLPGESTAETTRRLAALKAANIAHSFPQAFVIGSDQLAEHEGSSVGKPESVENAVAQLMKFSGSSVNFYTAVTVMCLADEFSCSAMDTTEVVFRELDEREVRRYVELDQPLDCAGGFKSESAGPMLMQSIKTVDPTAIIGLPLISLTGLLRKAGFRLP